jgi:hypothetical protein
MATFATLKLSTAVKPTHMPAVQMRRNKLAKRLCEQAELAKAQQAGTERAIWCTIALTGKGQICR